MKAKKHEEKHNNFFFLNSWTIGISDLGPSLHFLNTQQKDLFVGNDASACCTFAAAAVKFWRQSTPEETASVTIRIMIYIKQSQPNIV